MPLFPSAQPQESSTPYGKGHVHIIKPPYNWEDEESSSSLPEPTQNVTPDVTEVQTPKHPRIQYMVSLFREFGVVFRELRMSPNDTLLEDARKRGEAGEPTIIHVRW